MNNFLSNKFDISVLSHRNDHLLLDFSPPFNFNRYFNSLFNFNDFRYFSDYLHNFLNDFCNFNDSLLNSWNFDQSLNNKGFKSWDFNGHIYSVLYDLIFSYLIWSFYSFFNLNDFGDFDNFLYDSFYNFLDLNNLWSDSVNFENVINIDNVHNLLSNHSDDSLINFRDNTAPQFHFFHFFQKGLNQDSEMELNLSRLFIRISIHIFDFDNLRNILNNLNDPIKLINFHDIDNFLTKELSKSAIHFVIKFRVLSEEFFIV